jgi:uncharacterized membrane protein HdeD (DUF308 family)
MVTGMMRPNVAIDVVQRNWGWFLALGIGQIILGTIAVGESRLMTVFSVKILGWLLIIGGVMSVIHSFMERGWGGFIVDLLTGLLYAIVGFMLVSNPVESAVSLTLVIAMFLFIGGIFRIVEGLVGNFPHRMWVLLNGVVTLALGIMIWRQWPLSGLWVIGLFVGIEMIFYGWSLVMLALAGRSMPRAAATAS